MRADNPVASLTTAIIFHQIFEGLSLGIRIAALPLPEKLPSPAKGSDEERAPSVRKLDGLDGIVAKPYFQEGSSAKPPLRRSRSTDNLAPREVPSFSWTSLLGRQSQTEHSDEGYGSTSRSNRTLGEGSSRGTESAVLGKSQRTSWMPNPLKSTLSILFAITTPLGMVLGLFLWKGREGDIEQGA